MKQAICVGTYPGNISWFINFYTFLKGYTKYPIVVVINDDDGKMSKLVHSLGWECLQRKGNNQELGFIHSMYHHTDYDEFFYLHESVEIKDAKLFHIAFKLLEGYNAALNQYPAVFGMFMGKYTRHSLDFISIPLPKSKAEGAELEMKWTRDFAAVHPDKTTVMFPGLKDMPDDWAIYEDKFGRKNKILENEYIKKYKASWHRSMINEGK